MHKILTFFLIIGSVGLASAQQESQFTQYMYNQQNLNPGYVGSKDVPSFVALYRSQWLGFEGAPQSQLLNFQSNIFGDKVGFGLGVFHRSIGIADTWRLSMAYSYPLKLTEDLTARVGIQASMRSLGLDFSDPSVVIRDRGDASVAANGSLNEYNANVGLGTYITFRDVFYAGISVPNLYPNTIGVNPDESVRTALEQAHFYGIFGANVAVNDNIKIKPSILLKYTKNAPFDFDANMMMTFRDELSAGLSYRLGGNGAGESASLLLHYQITSQFGLGAAYDFTLSQLRNYNSGTFEVMATFDIRKEREDVENPRYY